MNLTFSLQWPELWIKVFKKGFSVALQAEDHLKGHFCLKKPIASFHELYCWPQGLMQKHWTEMCSSSFFSYIFFINIDTFKLSLFCKITEQTTAYYIHMFLFIFFLFHTTSCFFFYVSVILFCCDHWRILSRLLLVFRHKKK